MNSASEIVCPWRARAGLGLVLFMAGLGCCTTTIYYFALKSNSGETDRIVMDAARFEGVQALLPQRGVIGYLSDTGGKEKNPRAYYLTQYYLAPVVVAPDYSHEVVIANFASRAAIGPVALAHGFYVERDFADGVALLRKIVK